MKPAKKFENYYLSPLALECISEALTRKDSTATWCTLQERAMSKFMNYKAITDEKYLSSHEISLIIKIGHFDTDIWSEAMTDAQQAIKTMVRYYINGKICLGSCLDFHDTWLNMQKIRSGKNYQILKISKCNFKHQLIRLSNRNRRLISQILFV